MFALFLIYNIGCLINNINALNLGFDGFATIFLCWFSIYWTFNFLVRYFDRFKIKFKYTVVL